MNFSLIIFLVIICFSFTLPAFANPIRSSWVTCEVHSDGKESQQNLGFYKNNVMFEMHAFTKPSKIPCSGVYELLIGIYWHYEVNENVVSKTSFSSYLMIIDPVIVPKFNKNKVCGKNNWKVNERVDCSDDAYLSDELGRGRKNKQQYSIVGDELYIVEDGHTTIYKKAN